MKVNNKGDDQLALKNLNREEIVQFLLDIIKHPQKCVDFPITQWLSKYESLNGIPNFTEAALLIESAGQIYSRKVTFLEDLVFSIAKGTSASTSELNGECPTQKKRRKKIIPVDVNEIECIPKEIKIKSLGDQLCEKLNIKPVEFNEKLEKTVSIYKKDHKSNQLKTLAYPKLRVAMTNQINSGAIFGKHRICDKDNDTDSRQNYKVFMNYLNEENHSIGKIVQKKTKKHLCPNQTNDNDDDFDYNVDKPCPSIVNKPQFHWYMSATYLKDTYELNVENNSHYLNMLKYQNEIRNILLLDESILYNFQNGKQLNNLLCGKQQIIDENEFDDTGGEINIDDDDYELNNSSKNVSSALSEHDSGFYTQSSANTTNSTLSSMDLSNSCLNNSTQSDDQIRQNSDISSQVIDELIINSANTTKTTNDESQSNNSLNNLSMEESVNINSSLDLTIPSQLDNQLTFDDLDTFSNTNNDFTLDNSSINLTKTPTNTEEKITSKEYSNLDDNNLIVPCTENSTIENSDLNELSLFEQSNDDAEQQKSNIRDSIDTGINLCISHLDECDRAMLLLTPVVELYDIFGSMGSLIEEEDKQDIQFDLNNVFQNVYKIGDENSMVSAILLDGNQQPQLQKLQQSPIKFNIFKIPETKLRHKLIFSLPKDEFDIWKNRYSQSKRKGSPPPPLADPKRTKMTINNLIINNQQHSRDSESVERELDFYGFESPISPIILNSECKSANSLRSSFSFDSGLVDGTPIDTDKEDDNSLRTSPIHTKTMAFDDENNVITCNNKENEEISETNIENEVNNEQNIENKENPTAVTESIIDSGIFDEDIDDIDNSDNCNQKIDTIDDLLNDNDNDKPSSPSTSPSTSPDQQINKSSELLLDQINSKRLAKLDEMKELNDRVRQWHESLRPAILLSQKRNHFDIHDFGTKIINLLKCSTNVTATFQDVLTNNDESYTANYFLSLLQLVNARNVDLIIDRNDNNQHESFKYENISIKLLSEVRHKI